MPPCVPAYLSLPSAPVTFVGGPRLHLESLVKLGIDRATAGALKASLEKSDVEAIDPFAYVPVAVLARHAERLGKPELAPILRSALSVTKSPPLVAKSDPSAYPAASVSASAPRPFGPGANTLEPRELAPYVAALESLVGALVKQGKLEAGALDPRAPVDASALAAVLSRHAGSLRNHPTLETGLTGQQVEALQRLVASKALPAHTERDVELNLDSKHRLLVDRAGVKVYLQQGWEGFSLRRTAPEPGDSGASGFSLHGFKRDALLIAVPEGHSLLVVDAEGHERAARLPTKSRALLGEQVKVAELTRGMVEPSGSRDRVWNPSFTVKVLDPSGKPVLEQALAFDQVPSWTSNEVARGAFGYQPRPEALGDDVARWILDHGAPAGSKNGTPVGRRPAFALGEAAGDRLLVKRDGEAFPVHDLLQLLAPPKRAAQAFTAAPARGGPPVTYTLRDANGTAHVDEPERGRLPIALAASDGKSLTFDPDLHQTLQARMGLGGITVYERDGSVRARFDPLDPAQDRNAARANKAQLRAR